MKCKQKYISKKNYSMSDSDHELLTRDNFTFHNEGKAISVRGPSVNNSNVRSMSFRNGASSSTLQLPRNFERQRYAESNCEQQNMNYRRAASPMSIMSACDARQRNFNSFYNSQAMSSQRSTYYGRSRSPMSVRSKDSLASVSAVDIAMALNTTNFNKYDLQLIRNAYNKVMKNNKRKHFKRRRNLKLFLQGRRRMSGGDSGDQASNSSISSDDNSTRSYYKGNASSCRSTKTDIPDRRNNYNEGKMYKDSTDNFRQNTLRYIGTNQADLNNTELSRTSQRSMIKRLNIPPFKITQDNSNFNDTKNKPNSIILQKDKFKSGFVLPSKRFNQSVASTKIPENAENINHSDNLNGINYTTHKNKVIDNGTNRNNGINNRTNRNNETNSCTNLVNGHFSGSHRNNGLNSSSNRNNFESDSDQYDLFSETNPKQKTLERRTHQNSDNDVSLDSDDNISLVSQRRTNTISPFKNTVAARKTMPKKTSVNNKDNQNKDFEFVKPTFPIKKFAKEKIISKSATLTDTLIQTAVNPLHIQELQHKNHVVEVDNEHEDIPNSTQNTTDLSMRPSFIKRKLFTQRLDILEKKDTSTDSLNSPQNSIYGAIQKEKHKARKLQQVSTQSCLNRDVQQDKTNLLELIHKIVPQEKMNVTNHTNRTDLQTSNNKKDEENEDKWDVTSIMSTQKDDEDVSDTYTDEEIFNATVRQSTQENESISVKQIANKNESVKPPTKKGKNCKVVLENLPVNTNWQQSQKSNVESDDIANKFKWVTKCVKSFWDTDFESDTECLQPTRNSKLKENHCNGVQDPSDTTNIHGISNNCTSLKPTTASNSNATLLNNTVLQKINNTTLSLKSHRTSKRKKLDDGDYTQFESQCKKPKTLPNSNGIKISDPEPKMKKKIQNARLGGDTTVPPDSKSEDHVIHSNTNQPPKMKECTRSVKEVLAQKQILKENNVNETKEKTPQKKQKANGKTQDASLIEKNTNRQNTLQKKQIRKNINITLEEEPKKESNKNSVQNKQKVNNENPNKAVENAKTASKKVTTPSKKKGKEKNLVEEKGQSKKNSPKTKKTNTTSKPYSSVNEYSAEENNNSYRPLRSCRISKENHSLNDTNKTLNSTFCRTLRSRQIDLSLSSNLNITKTTKITKKTVSKDPKSRLSDVSFTLTEGKNMEKQHKKGVSKLTISRLLASADLEASDVSFSLTANESTKPKIAVTSKSRKNIEAGKKQNDISNLTRFEKPLQTRNVYENVSVNTPVVTRKRIPNKKYC